MASESGSGHCTVALSLRSAVSQAAPWSLPPGWGVGGEGGVPVLTVEERVGATSVCMCGHRRSPADPACPMAVTLGLLASPLLPVPSLGR